MILLNETPPGAGQDLTPLYQRMSVEGLVHSTLMRGEIYETSEEFEEDWACPAITWSVGGEENYYLNNGETFSIKPAGALIIGAGTRYNYAAGRDRSFYSNMITFPRWMTAGAAAAMLDEDTPQQCCLTTRLFRPDAETDALMNRVISHCRSGWNNNEWYVEQLALLYGKLLEAEHAETAALRRIEAAKPATQKELARRVSRAQQFVLQSYGDAGLDIAAIANAACLSPYHLIRVFKTMTRLTPMQYLAAVRMESALRLLRETNLTATGVAECIGFKDRAAFSRAFRRHHNFAPSAVRNA